MTLLPQMITPPGGVPEGSVYLADIARRVQGLEALRTKIGAGSINAGVLAAGTITGSLIQAGTITSSLIAANAINAGHIQAGVITSTHIAANTITAGNIAASTITSNEIAAATIQAADIAAHTITANEIAASTITSNEIAATTITAANIAAGTITATQIATGTITGSLIAGTTITGSNLVSATITADKLSVSNLAAISANLGTITAGTVTGATLQSSTSNPKTIMDSTGFKAINAAGTTTFFADGATGKITTLAGIGGGNLVKDSSFEKTTGTIGDDWTGIANTNIARTSAQVFHGAQAASTTAVAAGAMGIRSIQASAAQRIPVTAGVDYVGSAWVYNQARQARIDVLWWDSGGTNFQTTTGTTPVTPTASTWTRVVQTFTAPATAVTASIRVQTATAGAAAAEVAYVDAVQFEVGTLPTAYAPKPDEVLPATISGNTGGAGTGQIATGTIIGTDLVADTVTATQIAANAITAVELAANSVSAGHITAGAVTTVKLNAGAVTADKIGVASLSAISANIGSVSAGTVTGVTIQTASAGQRVVLDTAGLTAYGADGITPSVVLPTSGDALFRGALDAEGGLTFNVPISTPPPGATKAAWLDVNESEVASVFGITNTFPGSTNQALVASATGPLSYTTLVKNHANVKHYWKLNGGQATAFDSVAVSPKSLSVYTGTNGVAPSSASGLIAGADQAIQTNYQGRGWYSAAPAAAENVTTGWSVEYWIKVASKPLNDVRLVARSTTQDQLGTEYWKSTYKAATGKLEASIRIGAAAKIQTTTTVLALNTTYHVVHTYDGANIKTYLNGAADGAATAQTGSIDAQGTAYYNAGIIGSYEEDYHQGGGTATDGGNKSSEFTSWLNLANVASSNNAYATCSYPGTNPAGGAFSPELHVASWGAAIPAGATIRGIQVWIERKASFNISAEYQVIDVGVFVRKQDGTLSANKGVGDAWQTTDTWKNFGGPTDTWGMTWTPADINGSNFGAVFQAYATSPSGGSNTLSVDSVEISVYYSTSITLDEVAVYNAALTPTVISDHYQTGVTGISTSSATYQRKVVKSDGTSDFMDNKLVSALPGTPYDGQVIAYQSATMATAGVVWLLRYNAASASAYKWEYIGGPPLHSGVDTLEQTASLTYVALTTAGPSITTPLAGDYDVRIEASLSNNTANDGGRMSFDVAGTAAADADGILNLGSANADALVAGTRRKTSLAASTALVSKYKALVGGTASFRFRRMLVYPVRVG